MDQIHEAMRISLFLTPLQEVVEDDNGDILNDIVLAYSVDEERKGESDEEERS